MSHDNYLKSITFYVRTYAAKNYIVFQLYLYYKPDVYPCTN